jgi:outer membrane lipoprotein-sorting protein
VPTGGRDLATQPPTTLTTPSGKVSAKTKTYIEYPGRMRVEATLPDAQIVQVFADGKAWMQDPGGVRDAPPEMQAEFAASAKRDVVPLLILAATGKLQARLLNDEGFQGQVLKVLALSGEGIPEVRLHVDPQTGTVLKMAYESSAPAAPGGKPDSRPTEEVFTDYRTVAGISVPFKATVARAGQVLLERQLTAVQINADIPSDIFLKPR